MVLILKDGTRWKLDAATCQTRKLNQAVDVDNIVRYECIFMPSIDLKPHLAKFLAEVDKEVVSVQEMGLTSAD
jgi:hypothetical protein